MPVILVVPHRRDPAGVPLANSDTWGVRVYVESVPQEALVAGSDHIGLRIPDRLLYAEDITARMLEDRQLVVESLNITRAGIPIDAVERRNGDLILYQCASGVTDTIPLLLDADYYDLSDIRLEVELLPADRYNLVYEVSYYTRQLARGTDSLLCIDITQPALGLFRSQFNHPGEVLNEFYRLTPPPYLSPTATKSLDTTIALYRPFTDALQDVADEQKLLESLNWVHKIPYQAIPYLSALLGWDLPYFPESLDQLRLAVLRRTSRLQSIKGSRQALIEIFRLLGLEILISNLWWTPDGLHLIRPSALADPADPEAIRVRTVTQIEPLLAGYNTEGFGEFTIPLLHRPQIVGGLDDFAAITDGGDIVVDTYLVEVDSPADILLQQITLGGGDYPVGMLVDPDGFTDRYGHNLSLDQYGRQTGPIQLALAGLEVGGYSQQRLSGLFGTVQPGSGLVSNQFLVKGWGRPPITRQGVSFNRDTNVLNLTFSGYFTFDGIDQLPPKRRPSRIYSFATYTRQDIIVPGAMVNLQSNRFDIQLLITDTDPSLSGIQDYVDPTIFEFAFDFLYKIKAFHSLLNVLRYTVELNETYEVTTTCVGGDVAQRYDTDMGRLQVPPAKLILPPGGRDCVDYDPVRLGYQSPDIRLRLRKLTNLPEEFDAWKALDSRASAETYTVTGSRLPARPPASGRSECLFTTGGQDRVLGPRVERIGVEAHPGPNSNSDSTGAATVDLCPAVAVDRGLYDTGAGTSTRGDSSAYGNCMVEGVGDLVPWCDLDGTTDYCYKGRVGDEILYRPTLRGDEQYRPTAGVLGMGSGVYWTYPSYPVVWIPGTNSPGTASRTVPLVLTGGVGWAGQDGVLDSPAQATYLQTSYLLPLPPGKNNQLGRLYRDYTLPVGQSLHYSNRTQPGNLTQSHNLALQRPELGIDQPTLHLPGCRFLTMGNLPAHYYSGYNARPWDDQYSTACGPVGWCKSEPSWLNAYLVDLTDGSQELVYDVVSLIYESTGSTADIPSMSDHSQSAIPGTNVIHSALSTAPAGHPAITLDQIDDATGYDPDGTTLVPIPLFHSAVDCAGGYRDFIDGYAGTVGFLAGNYTITGHYGVTFSPLPSTALFLLGDGIQTVGIKAVRLDGGCLAVDCGEVGQTLCGLDTYIDQIGDRDWNSDQIWLESRIILEEPVGTGSLCLNGQAGSLFELIGGHS